MKLRYTKIAVADVDAIYDFIAADNPKAAEAVVQQIDRAIQGLPSHPWRGRPGRVPGTRELVVAKSPYVVAYSIDEGGIAILAVLHAARLWPSSF